MSNWIIKPFSDIYKLHEDLPACTAEKAIGFDAEGAFLFSQGNKVYRLFTDHFEMWSPSQTHRSAISSLSHRAETETKAYYFLDDHHRLYCFDPSTRILFQWNDQKQTLEPFVQLPAEASSISSHFFIDSHGRIWGNFSGAQFARIDPHHLTFQMLHFTQQRAAGIQTPRSIRCEDQQQNMWVGTGGLGLIKISSRNDQFSRLTAETQKDFGVRVAHEGSMYRIHDSFHRSDEEEIRDRLTSMDLQLAGGFAQDPLGHLWSVAIDKNQKKHFLVEVHPDDHSLTTRPLQFCQQIPYEIEFAIMFDRSGQLWMGSECVDGKASLVRQHTNDETQDTYTFPIEVIHNEHAFITDWYVDDQNIFWIGTKQGLFFFNPSNSQWKQWHPDPGRKDAISNHHILSICPDPASPDEYLWIGTDGGGLNKMNIHTETFQHFTTDEGLPNNVIYAVQSDLHNNLWMSTNLGLCRFDPSTADVWSFTMQDGLPSNEFNRMQYGSTSDGRLYFSGTEGETVFDPEVFYAPADVSPIVINRLKLSNKEVFFSNTSARDTGQTYHLPAPLENCTQLTFPYTERMITLGFSLLDFTNPKGNKYRYKLEGFNSNWIETGAEHEAVFTNLSPGHYTFLVSGRNSKNIWSPPAQLQLTILSPWWGTLWFRIAVVLLIAAGIYTVYRYRLNQAFKIQNLRNRIAADLHDEIGSTLSSISLAGTVIQHKLKSNDKEVNGLLDKINTHTQTMMEAMSDIVWAVNTKNDRFDHVLHRMRAFAVEILEPKDIMVHFDVSPNVSALQLDMQKRKNLYLIFKEVIHNAAKYAQCNNVWVKINYTSGKLMMDVRDNGVGFDVLDHKPATSAEAKSTQFGLGGNGIQNMYQRAMELKGKLELNSSPGQGTSVKLVFEV